MSAPELRAGIPAGFVDELTNLHVRYYARHWGFESFFEQRVRAEAAAFVRRFDPARDGVWYVGGENGLAGSITIDGGGTEDDTAHLRWFIIDDSLRGTGLGNRLMHAAVTFCRSGAYRRIYLTTFAGLDAARHLYEKNGFELVHSETGASWGTEVTEQRFELFLGDTFRG